MDNHSRARDTSLNCENYIHFRCIALLRLEGWLTPVVMAWAGDHRGPIRLAPIFGTGPIRVAEPEVTAARIAARLREGAYRLTYGSLVIDRMARTAARGGRPLDLLPREYALLLKLIEARGAPISRAALISGLWGLRFDPGTNRVEVHVSRLRAKLDGGEPFAMLRTERGVGYSLVAEPPRAV